MSEESYTKQILRVLLGSIVVNDTTVIPAAADPANDVSLYGAVRKVFDENTVLYDDWINGGRLDLILDSLALEATLAVVDGIVDTILVDTNELQTDWADGGRLDLIIDAILADTGTDGVVLNSLTAAAETAIEAEVEDALQAMHLDHLQAVATAAADMTAEVVDASVLSRMLSKTSDTSTYDPTTDAQEMLSDKLGGFSGDGGAAQDDSTKASLDLAHTDLDAILVEVDERVMGRTQVKEFSVTAAANAGVTNVATVTTQAVLIKSCVIHADAAQTVDMTSCGLFGGAGQVVELIAAAVAVQASLDAADKQVYANKTARLAATKTIDIDLQGTGATAVDLTVVIEYVACADGGYLA